MKPPVTENWDRTNSLRLRTSPGRAVTAVYCISTALWLGGAGAASASETSLQSRIVPACGYASVAIVSATSDEATAVCTALADVVQYFADAGLLFEPAFTITFRANPIKVDASAHPHGYFDAKAATITMIRNAEDEWWQLNRAEELLTTLDHELTHMAVSRVWRDGAHPLPKAWQEFVAYAVELDIMPIELRSRVLATYKEAPHFDSEMQINPIIFALADPDWLAVASYSEYVALGGRGFLLKLLRGEIKSVYDPVLFDFM